MATAREERKFEKQMAAEKKARYHEMKAAGKLPTLHPEQIRYQRRKKMLSIIWPIFRFLILFGLCFVILYPLMFMLSTAFRPNEQMNDPTIVWLPKSLTIDNIKRVWDLIDYPGTMLDTVTLNIGASILQVGTCALTGYGFARFKFKGRNLMFAIVMLMIVVPPQILAIPQFMNFRYFDLFGIGNLLNLPDKSLANFYGSPVTIYAPAILGNGIRAGLFIYIFRQFFRGLPKELEDAAYLDGCGPLRTFVSIMIPNAKSSFLTVFLFSIVWYWNDFYVTTLFLEENTTIALMLTNLQSAIQSVMFANQSPGIRELIVWLESGCILAIAPILLMYIFLQRYFIEGVERSGIVG
ncbi:MAG: carbohydrate ABC transporter permease [Oscillospiraceae bacterium]